MKRLGDILVESGFLNATELAEVLSVQKETGKRLGEVIVESGLMSEFDILRAVSSQYNYPIIDLAGIDVDPKATALLTQKFCEENIVFPIGFDNDNLVVAIDDPMNITIEDELQFQTGYQVSLMLATHSSIVDAIRVMVKRVLTRQLRNLVQVSSRIALTIMQNSLKQLTVRRLLSSLTP